jgi:hypothetical protein
VSRNEEHPWYAIYYFGSYIGKAFKITSKAIKILMAVWLALCGGQPPNMAAITPAIQVL